MKLSLAINLPLLALAFASPTFGNDPACERVRAAFDVGSSQTKLKVFKVNICNQTAKQVYPAKGDKQQDCQSRSNLPFKTDLDQGIEGAGQKAAAGKPVNWKNFPRFSQDLISDGVEAPDPCNPGQKVTVSVQDEFKRLSDIARNNGATDLIGIATQAFRESQNTDHIIDFYARKYNMTLLVPTGAQEALIEWMSATSDIKSRAENANVNVNSIVTWGIGAGSMQIGAKAADGSFASFPSTLASENIYRYAANQIKGSDQLLPMSASEVQQLVDFASQEVNKASSQLKSRIAGGLDSSTKVVGVGGVINKSLRFALKNVIKVDRDFFTDRDVERLLQAFSDKPADHEVFKTIDPNFLQGTIPNVALVMGAMNALGIRQVWYSDVDNTLGVLFTKEFGIKMAYVKPTVASPTVAAAQRKASGSRERPKVELVAQETSVAPTKEQAAAALATSNGSDENSATCASAPRKTLVGGTCTISEPCMNFTDLCDNKASAVQDKKCIMRGKTTLIYQMCPQ